MSQKEKRVICSMQNKQASSSWSAGNFRWQGEIIHTSAALLPVLGPSLSNTLGLRDGAAGLLVLLLVVVLLLLLLSDMVFEFSTVTFRLILDILQDCKYDKQSCVNHLHPRACLHSDTAFSEETFCAV